MAVVGAALVGTALPAGAALASPPVGEPVPDMSAVPGLVASAGGNVETATTAAVAVPCFMGRRDWNVALVGTPPVCHVRS
jgi:hypothetical protein